MLLSVSHCSSLHARCHLCTLRVFLACHLLTACTTAADSSLSVAQNAMLLPVAGMAQTPPSIHPLLLLLFL